MQNIKLIGLDLDGTVFNNQKVITPRTILAIEQAIQEGIVVVPATGRPYVGLPEQFLEIKGVRYALTSNGASVIDLSSHSILYSNLMSNGIAIDTIKVSTNFDCLMDVYIDGKSYTTRDTISRISEYMLSPEMTEYFLKTRSVIDEDMSNYISNSGQAVEKIQLLFKNLEEKARVSAILETIPDITITSALPNNIEINASTANKGDGLLGLGRILGINQENIMACGDSFNDYEMIRQVGYGVAMGNADPEIKDIADYITLSNQEDGVAHIIEQLL